MLKLAILKYKNRKDPEPAIVLEKDQRQFVDEILRELRVLLTDNYKWYKRRPTLEEVENYVVDAIFIAENEFKKETKKPL